MAKKTFTPRWSELTKQMYIPETDSYTEALINESDYLAISSKWQELRRERMRMDGHRCAQCGSPYNLEIHHINYPSAWGLEKPEDLVTLCHRCHKDTHDKKEK